MRLTDREVDMLRAIVRREAVGLGHGTIYFSSNKRTWPRRLKDLTTLWRKLSKEVEDRKKGVTPW